MWKIWLALGLTVIAAVLTIGMGILYQARVSVILQRTIISILIMGCCGYMLSLFMERIGFPYLLRETASAGRAQANDDSLMEEESEIEEATETEEKKEFAPFTVDNLNRVSPPNG